MPLDQPRRVMQATPEAGPSAQPVKLTIPPRPVIAAPPGPMQRGRRDRVTDEIRIAFRPSPDFEVLTSIPGRRSEGKLTITTDPDLTPAAGWKVDLSDGTYPLTAVAPKGDITELTLGQREEV